MKKRAAAWTAGLTVVAVVQTLIAIRFGAERVQLNVYALTLPIALVFIRIYARDPWWKSWFGRSLMLIAVALTLQSVATILYRRFGEYPGRPVLIIAAADAAFAAMLIRTLVLRRAQHDDRDNPHSH